MHIHEFEIPVPWGQISVKAWGAQQDTPVLLLHGLMDNAGTFDRLIPHLPTTFYYLCIDLPGHGKSSHTPPHMPIHPEDFVVILKLVVEFFKRSKYIIMGHSFGGQIAICFAQLYPDNVTKLVMFDAVRFYTTPAKEFKKYMVTKINHFCEHQKKTKEKVAPIYIYEQALGRLMSGRAYNYSISKEAAERLLQRMLIPVGNEMYKFSTDQRLKLVFYHSKEIDYAFEFEVLQRFPLQCPVLFILAKQSESNLRVYKPVLDLLAKQSNIEIRHVDGHHEIHNDKPEVVAPLVSKFLFTNVSKL